MAFGNQSVSGIAGLTSQSGAGADVEYIFKVTAADSAPPPPQTCQGQALCQLAGLTIA